MPPDQTSTPQSRQKLAADLRTLGVTPGMTLILHSSLSAIGWVVGGAEAVLLAVMDVLGPGGTLMVPTFSGQTRDPDSWVEPDAPEDWRAALRAHALVYHPQRTPTEGMGQIPEAFRTWPGVLRSAHPVLSFAAWGRHAATLTADHAWAWGFGATSPLARLYDLDGHVLLGVGHGRNSSLHFAESRATNRRTQSFRLLSEQNGARRWDDYPQLGDDRGVLFPKTGAAFEAMGGVMVGKVGEAEARLMRQRALVDFATPFLDRALVELQQRQQRDHAEEDQQAAG